MIRGGGGGEIQYPRWRRHVGSIIRGGGGDDDIATSTLDGLRGKRLRSIIRGGGGKEVPSTNHHFLYFPKGIGQFISETEGLFFAVGKTTCKTSSAATAAMRSIIRGGGCDEIQHPRRLRR